MRSAKQAKSVSRCISTRWAMSASAPRISTIGRTTARRFLGMQLVDKSRGTLALRMDDRKQRVIVHSDEDEGPAFYGWEVADAAALDALAAHLEKHGVKVARGSRALADERRVKDLIVFSDPIGNRLEVFHGAEIGERAVQARPLDLRLPHRPARHGPCRAHRGTARRGGAVLYRDPQFQADRLYPASRSRPISSTSMRATTASPSSIPARTASIT